METSVNEIRQHEAEVKPLSENVLLVFGQGPVIDNKSRIRAEDAQTLPTQEDINLWSKGLVSAAGKLYELHLADDIVVMGGKTGGEKYASEAELIANQMQTEGIPQASIHKEKDSLDTLENIVNFLNLHDRNDEIAHGNYALSLLGAPYHTTRLQVLAKLCDLPIKHIFQSTEVLRYYARTIPAPNGTGREPTSDPNQWDQKSLSQLETELDLYRSSNFYAQQSGTEKRDYFERFLFDNLLTRELLQYPEKWLSQVGGIKNRERVVRILSGTEQLYPDMLQNKYGIELTENMTTADIDAIREKLQRITYNGLPLETIDEWKQDNLTDKGWPRDVTERFKMLFEDQT